MNPQIRQECAYCTDEATTSCHLCHVGYCASCLKEHLELNEEGIMLCPQQQLDLEVLNPPLVQHLEKVCENYASGTSKDEVKPINIGITDYILFREGLK